MRRIYNDCKVTQTNIVFGFYRGLSHLTGVRNRFFDSRDMSRITRNYEKSKNYKYLQVINKSKDFDKKYKKWLSSAA